MAATNLLKAIKIFHLNKERRRTKENKRAHSLKRHIRQNVHAKQETMKKVTCNKQLSGQIYDKSVNRKRCTVIRRSSQI